MAEASYRSTPAFAKETTAPTAHGIDEAYDDVRRFHRTFRFNSPERPTMQDRAAVSNRIDRIIEELEELRDAPTLVDQADAYLDIIYYGVGGMVELGIRPSNLWRAVQRANMAKLWDDGLAHYHPNGKVAKPPNWVGPEEEIAAEIAKLEAEWSA